jgi:hypothetical protein
MEAHGKILLAQRSASFPKIAAALISCTSLLALFAHNWRCPDVRNPLCSKRARVEVEVDHRRTFVGPPLTGDVIDSSWWYGNEHLCPCDGQFTRVTKLCRTSGPVSVSCSALTLHVPSYVSFCPSRFIFRCLFSIMSYHLHRQRHGPVEQRLFP